MEKRKKAKSIKTWHILPHLAVKGMANNGTAYYPYLAAGIFSAFTFFVFSSILRNDIISILPKCAYAWIFLSIGRVDSFVAVSFLYELLFDEKKEKRNRLV